MSKENEIGSRTRRHILEAVAGTLGVAAAGSVAGHPGSGDHGEPGHTHPKEDTEGTTGRGYHSLGDFGPERIGGTPEEPHYGGISELRVDGERGLAYVGILSSKEPTLDRGMAILDVSEYTEASSPEEIDDAEMVLLSFVENENGAASVMDVKLSADGEYAFICKQPVAALFGEEETGTDGNSADSPEAGALQAVDVSDPDNPEIVGRYDAWGFGPHNCDHQRIDETDYVFAVKGPVGSPAAVYVVQFDRSTGAMLLVNYWTHDTQLAQGQVGSPVEESYANGNEYYAHDVRIQEDPQTGDHYAYLANWNSGARVLDVSTPTNIEELGVFDMDRAHTIEVPERPINGKRVFVVGQENGAPDRSDREGEAQDRGGYTGFYYLVDASEVDDPGFDGDLGTASDNPEPASAGDELDKWVWRANAFYEDGTFILSAHNIDILDLGDRQFVTAGHYHAGIRILEMEVGAGATDSSLEEVAYFRSHEKVPQDSKFGGLTAATPDFWCAVTDGQTIYGSGINTGIYALTLDIDDDAGGPPDIRPPEGRGPPEEPPGNGAGTSSGAGVDADLSQLER